MIKYCLNAVKVKKSVKVNIHLDPVDSLPVILT